MDSSQNVYKMIIVDDEYFNREQLTNLVDWERLGYSVVGVFETYDEAMTFIVKNEVDVIFTDIRLGNHNGLELIETARKLFPDIGAVVISAYSEFEYAQTAISLDVFEYLLKPVYIEKVVDCFTRLRQRLDESAARRLEAREYAGFAHVSLYGDIFSGIIRSRAEAADFARENHIGFSENNSSYLLIRLTDRKNGFKNLPFYGENSITVLLRRISGQDETYAVALNAEELYVLLIVPIENRRSTHKVFREFCRSLASGFGKDVEYSVVDSGDDLFELARRFLSASGVEPSYDDFMLKIKEYIKSGEALSAANIVGSAAGQYGFDDGALRDFIRYVIDGISENETPDAGLIEEFLARLDSLDRDGIFEEVRTLFRLLSKQMSNPTYNEYYITVAKKYVLDHISEDISLEKVAECVALSPAYFSRYFRETTGVKFIDYLNHARVEHAKKLLLHPDTRISEVYKLVGYHSRSWFYTIFAGETGYTPYEYRKKHMTGGKGRMES